jgi:uncharacterized protein DUF3562
LAESSTNLAEVRVTFQRQPMKWQGVVESLGEEFSWQISEVERMLSAAAHQLEQGAQIKEFIPVLAVRQVKDLLRKSRHTPSQYGQHNLNHPLPATSNCHLSFQPVPWRELVA